ncbi:MAG: hypothetical protein EOP02_37020, partial [Proteobacteria bacterium]
MPESIEVRAIASGMMCMKSLVRPWSRRLAWALPMLALLAGCDGSKDAGKVSLTFCKVPSSKSRLRNWRRKRSRSCCTNCSRFSV